MKRTFSLEHIFAALSILPLVIFLRVAGWYGFTYAAWMRAFLAGAALASAVLFFFFLKKNPVRDILLASSLFLVSGGIAFLAGAKPVLDFYLKWQGSVFIAWYLAVRAGLLFAPGLFTGLVRDPYAKRAELAFILSPLAMAWSVFHRNLLLSTVLPVALLLFVLSLAGRSEVTQP